MQAVVVTAAQQKAAAAQAALGEVKDGMRLGLGTGSTVAVFLALLAKRVASGLDIVAVPTSEATRLLAESLGIALASLDDGQGLDLAIDGADELDPQLDLIKGGGGALLREKIVAAASRRFVIIADEAKRVAVLGNFPLPVEIVPFGAGATLRLLAGLMERQGAPGPIELRRHDGQPFVSDNGNLIADCRFGQIGDPATLAGEIAALPGVVDHGLFVHMASCAYVGTPQGVLILQP